MDPTVCLDQIRALAAVVLARYDAAPATVEPADELAQQVADLDEWLSRGGALPAQWPVPEGLAAPPF